MKNIAIIGSTGSVGENAADIARRNKEEFSICALAVCSNTVRLQEQCEEFNVRTVYVADSASAVSFQSKNSKIKVYSGPQGLKLMLSEVRLDLIVAASSGSESLEAVLSAIDAGVDIALANKELMVMAGHLVVRAVEKSGSRIIPVDSEHNAIFQCLAGKKINSEVRKIILTGTGGPLKDVPSANFAAIEKEVVLNHPKWSMGPKITTDSALMMNKGLELIEACWLFNAEPDQIQIIIHPQAIVHSMVEFVDGSVLAHLGNTDMRLPLIHAMSYPDRTDEPDFRMDWSLAGRLDFSDPDQEKFKCLGYARKCAEQRYTTLPTVLNAADEVAVDAFLNDRILFVDIPEVIRLCLEGTAAEREPDLDGILKCDRLTRKMAEQYCAEYEKISK
ncbi:MAG: 1-deoxy-D-xylulose-5-phosphate reductoisomerase [Candidatus Omnitrophica bacterium]|nr:1-deoxy-D-xylulose-5-phosphate reductoisomerase [Candidatus Omnitrophota bacterium]